MEKLSGGHLAGALERNRERFNAAFAQARRINRNLDPDDFALHICLCIEPIVKAVGEAFPEKIDHVVMALYDLSLELFNEDCLGQSSHHPLIGEAWLDLLPKIPGLLAEDPLRLAASVSNAVYTLSVEQSVDPRRWMREMEGVAPLCDDVGRFLEAGKVLAWRCGMAHYRESAIETWKKLPEKLMYATIGMADFQKRPSLDEIKRALANPWRPPDKTGDKKDLRLSIVAEVGGFRGFGGPFIEPPLVTSENGRFHAFDSQFCWTLYADCFGATLQRCGPPKHRVKPEPTKGFTIWSSGDVTWNNLKEKFPALKNFSSYAETETTMAVTLPGSHKIFLVAIV